MVSLKKARELCSDDEFALVSTSYPGVILELSVEEAKTSADKAKKLMYDTEGRTKKRLFREAFERFELRAEGDSEGDGGSDPSSGGASTPGGTKGRVSPAKKLVARAKTRSSHQRAAQKRTQAKRDTRNS